MGKSGVGNDARVSDDADISGWTRPAASRAVASSMSEGDGDAFRAPWMVYSSRIQPQLGERSLPVLLSRAFVPQVSYWRAAYM